MMEEWRRACGVFEFVWEEVKSSSYTVHVVTENKKKIWLLEEGSDMWEVYGDCIIHYKVISKTKMVVAFLCEREKSSYSFSYIFHYWECLWLIRD